jgi:hypothetical protein
MFQWRPTNSDVHHNRMRSEAMAELTVPSVVDGSLFRIGLVDLL